MKVYTMEIFGYPLWVVGFICFGVFCASFVDAIGGGGGIISVPSYLLAGIPVHFALGTNKLSSCIGTVASTVRYIRNGCVDWLLGIPSIALALFGAHIGTRLQLAADEKYLKLLLLIVLPVIAVILLKKKALPEQRDPMNEWRRRGIVWGSAFVIGAYDGFYGPGTGTFSILLFVHIFGLDDVAASGTAKVPNLCSNIAALTSLWLAGDVLWMLGLPAGLCSMAGAALGTRLTIRKGSKMIRGMMLFVLILLLVKMITDMLQ